MQRYYSVIDSFEDQVKHWRNEFGETIRHCYTALGYPSDTPTNPVVFNDDLRCDPSDAEYILVADNPGLEEQQKNRYLIGKAGNTARNFYANELGIEFKSKVLVLNKIPIYTNSTEHLSIVQKHLPEKVFKEMQTFMADLAIDLMQLLGCDLWITGVSKLDGLFKPYADAIRATGDTPEIRQRILCFKHFSFGNFKRDYNARAATVPNELPIHRLSSIGKAYRKEKLMF